MIVADNGEGIEPSTAENIFDLYTRGHINSKGNGVGLYLVKKIVGELGGQVRMRTEVGKGSVFEVIIPMAQTVSLPKSLERSF
jgi:signal transduction histidine kinase